MDQDTGFGLETLHQVRGIMEVRPNAANELLEAGWILHEVYLTQDFESRCIVIRLDDTLCPQCGGPARVEALDSGERVRFICQNECHCGFLGAESDDPSTEEETRGNGNGDGARRGV